MQRRFHFLVEAAIVLVILGLLVGAVFKGQELIAGARGTTASPCRLGIKAAFFGLEDRYRALPGDYSFATQNIAGAAGSGNGNGRIEVIGNPVEILLVWDHLSKAGLLNYGFSATSAVSHSSATSPPNAYGGLPRSRLRQRLRRPCRAPEPAQPQNGAELPVALLAEVDRKIDDGTAAAGIFRGSAAFGASGQDNCWDASRRWLMATGFPNCAGTELF